MQNRLGVEGRVLLTLACLAAPLSAGSNGAQKLLADDGALGDILGTSVSIDGNRALVGAPGDDEGGLSGVGSAYVFSVTTGAQLAKLMPLDGDAGDEFGISVGLSGTTAIIGARTVEDLGLFSGAAYLFDAGSGVQQQKLLASDGAIGHTFGGAVAIDGNTAVVGAVNNGGGTTYVFNASTGAELFRLTALDGEVGDSLGASVAISGSTVAAGAPGDDDGGSEAGAVYLFDATTGMQLHKLVASDGAPGDTFGFSVAISGSTVVVGSPGDDDGASDSGSVYLFDAVTGAQLDKLRAGEWGTFDRFGTSVSMSGTTIVVGAVQLDFGGAVHVFDATTGALRSKFLAGTGAGLDEAFGSSVSIDGGTTLVGAWKDDETALNAGAAFAFGAPPGTPGCFGDTGCPCGNDNPNSGCRNSSGPGAFLFGLGSTSVALDDLELITMGCPPDNSGLYVMGDSLYAPILVGDGLNCTGGLFRFLPGAADSDGNFLISSLVAQAPPGSIVSGATRHFQSWTRDVLCGPPPAPCPSPCMLGSNLSSSYSITFTP